MKTGNTTLPFSFFSFCFPLSLMAKYKESPRRVHLVNASLCENAHIFLTIQKRGVVFVTDQVILDQFFLLFFLSAEQFSCET